MEAERRDQNNAVGDVEANVRLLVQPERGVGGEVQRHVQDAAIKADGRGGDEAPENKLTRFALRLAILEKAASRLGALGLVWATVVLLGSFAVNINNTDFWLVTGILIVQGASVFSRSHELEWQLQSPWSFTKFSRNPRLMSFLRSSSCPIGRPPRDGKPTPPRLPCMGGRPATAIPSSLAHTLPQRLLLGGHGRAGTCRFYTSSS